MARTQTLPPGQSAQYHISMRMLKNLQSARARQDPILTDKLLACSQETFYNHHDAPQKALFALAELLHSHAQTLLEVKCAAGKASPHAPLDVEPENLAYLLEVIARGMQTHTCEVAYAETLRKMHTEIGE